jgi:glycosyltransferase involved in cell wall biosynthesis
VLTQLLKTGLDKKSEIKMSLEYPLVSVVIPVRNGERFIARTLTSVLAQTYRQIEIIVVDDGSTDGTVALVESAATVEPRIRLFQRSHAGLPATRNFGIGQAHGDLIAPLDGDDLWHPKKIEKQVHAMQKSSAIGLVYCWTVDIDEFDFVIPPIRRKSTVEGKVLIDVIANAGIIESGSNPLVRRSCLEAIGGYDARMVLGAEDWKMSLALADISEFAVVCEHLVGYRQASTTMSKNIAAMQQAFETVAQWIDDRWPNTPNSIKRQMRYHVNAYLAHQAISKNKITMALRYQIKGHLAYPPSLLTPTALKTMLRFSLRALGLRRSAFAVGRQARLFSELCQAPISL